MLQADRKPFAPFAKGLLAATTEEKAAAFESYAAYFGAYAIDAKAGTITHRLEDSLIPGRRDTDNVRWFEFQGNNRLYLIPASSRGASEYQIGIQRRHRGLPPHDQCDRLVAIDKGKDLSALCLLTSSPRLF